MGAGEPQRRSRKLRPIKSLSKIDGNVSVKASIEELQALSPKQLQAFMRGVGRVLAAAPARKKYMQTYLRRWRAANPNYLKDWRAARA